MKRWDFGFIRVTVLLFAVIFSVLAIYSCNIKIRQNIVNNTYRDLEDVGAQNVIAVKNTIETYQMALEGISRFIDEDMIENPREQIKVLQALAEGFGLKRIVICQPEGMSYGSDGTWTDLSYRNFFKDGMQGKSDITGVIRDQLDITGEYINIISIPIYKADHALGPVGVLGATFLTEEFIGKLELESFGGVGYTFVVDSRGTIVTPGQNNELVTGGYLFDICKRADSRNEAMIDELVASLEAGYSYRGICYLGGTNYYYCEPVSLMGDQVQWYVFTVVPESVLLDRQSKVFYHLDRLIAILAIIFMLVFILIVYMERKRVRNILDLTYTDSLTAAENYAAFKRDMAKINNDYGFIVSMDLADFRLINDAVGTSKGDVLIKEMWNIIREKIKPQDLAAHMNADQFIMFIIGEDRDALIEIMQGISEEIIRFSKSMGVGRMRPYFGVYFGRAHDLVEHDYSQASIAKNKIKNRRDVFYAFYDAEDHHRMMEDEMLCNNFNDALAEHRLEVWVQPKYSVNTGDISGGEALVRWRDESGKLIPPGRFIPMLESNGLIADMDEYMFINTCQLIKQWHDSGLNCKPISVNLSRASLYLDGVVDKYAKIVADVGISTNLVQIEITESALSSRSDMKNLLDDFRGRGFHILMDDFGMGYSSISTLSLGCFDTLKVDKSLVDEYNTENGTAILEYTIKMAKKLGLKVTAEGVELKEQLDVLKNLHCDDIQGYLMSKPLPCDEFKTLL